MTLAQLRTFLAVLETGSFSAAALELDSAQSAVSYAVAELERELGAKLLERGRFGARPTPTGKQIATHARQMLSLEEAVRQEAELSRGELSGTVRVATFRSVASHIVPKAMRQLSRSYPKLKVQLLEADGDSTELERLVFQGRAELSFMEAPFPNGLLSWELLRDPYVALMPKDHPLAASSVTRRDLFSSPLVLYDSGDKCSVRIGRYLKDAQASASHPSYNVREDSTIASFVGQGLGLSVVPTLAFLDLPDNVVRVPLAEPLERVIGVTILPSSLKIPAVRAFLGALKRHFPESSLPALEPYLKTGKKSRAAECPPELWLEAESIVEA